MLLILFVEGDDSDVDGQSGLKVTGGKKASDDAKPGEQITKCGKVKDCFCQADVLCIDSQ